MGLIVFGMLGGGLAIRPTRRYIGFVQLSPELAVALISTLAAFWQVYVAKFPPNNLAATKKSTS
jgi:hypothetical protein